MFKRIKDIASSAMSNRLKYILLICILGGVFIFYYRHSSDTGFNRWKTSFRLAILGASVLVGLIPASASAKDSSNSVDAFSSSQPSRSRPGEKSGLFGRQSKFPDYKEYQNGHK